MEIPELQESISHHADFDALLNICSTNKGIRNICESNHFWQEQYHAYGLPYNNKDQTFKDRFNTFIDIYNATLFSNYLANKHNPIIKFDGIYVARNILSILQDMNVEVNTKYDIHKNDVIVFHLDYLTPTMTIRKLKNYIIVLEYNHINSNNHQVINIASLSKPQLVQFLYQLILDGHVMYRSKYEFTNHYAIYNKQLNIPLYVKK